jgi:hypothetical protein
VEARVDYPVLTGLSLPDVRQHVPACTRDVDALARLLDGPRGRNANGASAPASTANER